MSDYDVPGKDNADVLRMGCWAEHQDGSLIFVEGNEGGDVIYSIFDMSKDPIVEFRDAMPETSFKQTYSWRTGKSKEKWEWHDKTPFPWKARVIKRGVTDGVRLASADATLTAAERIAQALSLKG